jgi:hypothetical protein
VVFPFKKRKAELELRFGPGKFLLHAGLFCSLITNEGQLEHLALLSFDEQNYKENKRSETHDRD